MILSEQRSRRYDTSAMPVVYRAIRDYLKEKKWKSDWSEIQRFLRQGYLANISGAPEIGERGNPPRRFWRTWQERPGPRTIPLLTSRWDAETGA